MATERRRLHERIESGGRITIVEVSPPVGGDPAPVRAVAKQYAGKVHALGISDNRDGVRMSALAAASLVASEGVEPVLHVVTRDRNRTGLVSAFLGARALGIRNFLCTSGTHQTLIRPRAARNVFDIDSIQLLQTYANLASDGTLVGEQSIGGCDGTCLGAVAAPYADPIELQLMRLSKKVAAGARFLITQPVFDLHRFDAWWEQLAERGIHRQVAVVAGIRLLTDAEQAKAYADQRPDPVVPDDVVERIVLSSDRAAQRKAGIEIAVETIQRLSGVAGLRGFEIRSDGDDDAVLEVISRSGLGTD